MDLQPALEDSAHFFYIQDLLHWFSSPSSNDAVADLAMGTQQQQQLQQPPVVRLAVFNFAEAWIFAFLPALLADERRLPLPAVLFAWVGGLGLTNAFLAPYLAIREGFAAYYDGSKEKQGQEHEQEEDNTASGSKVSGRNAVLSASVGAIATVVVFYACGSCLVDTSLGDWSDFARLATADRTYLAFCVDLVLFSTFQPFLLRKVYTQEIVKSGENESDPMPQIYNVPFVGLVAWLFGK